VSPEEVWGPLGGPLIYDFHIFFRRICLLILDCTQCRSWCSHGVLLGGLYIYVCTIGCTTGTKSHTKSHTMSHTRCHAHTVTHRHNHAQSHTYRHTRTQSRSHSHTHSHTRSHTHSHTHTHTLSHTLSHTQSHTVTHSRTHRHTGVGTKAFGARWALISQTKVLESILVDVYACTAEHYRSLVVCDVDVANRHSVERFLQYSYKSERFRQVL